MLRIATVAALVTGSLALSACGGSDHPKHPPKGPHGAVVMPAASPSIHFKVNDANGNTMDLMIECGADTSLKQCAEVNQNIIDKVTKIRREQAGKK